MPVFWNYNKTTQTYKPNKEVNKMFKNEIIIKTGEIATPNEKLSITLKKQKQPKMKTIKFII